MIEKLKLQLVVTTLKGRYGYQTVTWSHGHTVTWSYSHMITC